MVQGTGAVQSSRKVRVVKLGGSMLLRPRLREDVLDWLRDQTEATNFFVVGGGEIVDAVRRFDAVHPRDPQAVHWQCVRLLENTFEFVASLFPQWRKLRIAEDFIDFRKDTRSDQSNFIVNPSAYYRAGSEFDLPCSWETTTDSIAAALAVHVCANELVVLKSCEVPRSAGCEELIASGILDRSFAKIGKRIASLRIERLRQKEQ